MNVKNNQRHWAYEALVILGQLALLTYITRLWPILLLIILGIFIAALRLLFLASKKVEPIKPMPVLLPPPNKPSNAADVQTMAYMIIQQRISQILLSRFPDARWIWENPRAQEDILAGNPVYVLLNKAGGYRRGQVIIRQLQVIDVVFEEEKTKTDQPVRDPANNPDPMPPTPLTEEEDEPMPENFGLIAFSWVEAHVMELNDLCNEAIAEGLSEYLIPADELPVSESWEEVCKVLIRNDFHSAQCCDEGIIIEFEQ